MSFRSAIPDFSLANSLYIGATVTFWGVDLNGNKTGVLPILYANPTGPQTVGNPQVLDGEGKFSFPVYHEVPLIAEVSDVTGGSTETGIIMPAANWGGNWTPATIVQVNTFLRDPVNLSIYAATNSFQTSGSIAGDILAGNLILVFQGEAATIASNAAAAAVAAQTAAEAAAAAAAATLANAATKIGLSVEIPISNDGNRPTPTAGQRAITWSSVRSRFEYWDSDSWEPLSKPLSLDDLTNVDVPSPALNDVLKWDGTKWVSATSNIDLWSLQPIGGLVVLFDQIIGVSPPPTNQSYRYVRLTAGQTGVGQYNQGILTDETISGSAPTIIATAKIALVGSPMNGQSISLINTERRFLRAGSAGTLEDSQNLAHAHGVTDPGHAHTTYIRGTQANYGGGPSDSASVVLTTTSSF